MITDLALFFVCLYSVFCCFFFILMYDAFYPNWLSALLHYSMFSQKNNQKQTNKQQNIFCIKVQKMVLWCLLLCLQRMVLFLKATICWTTHVCNLVESTEHYKTQINQEPAGMWKLSCPYTATLLLLITIKLWLRKWRC